MKKCFGHRCEYQCAHRVATGHGAYKVRKTGSSNINEVIRSVLNFLFFLTIRSDK